MTLCIQPFSDAHWPGIWDFMEGVFRAGDTYPNAVNTTESEAYAYWINPEKTIHVALDENDRVIGTYYVRPNNIGLAAHVCNGGYMVSPNARGRGVATQLCQHSQDFAKAQGYLAMQYNLVVSTNRTAVSLWQKLGFDIIGTLPKAFDHKALGFVDAHVMYKWLGDEGS